MLNRLTYEVTEIALDLPGDQFGVLVMKLAVITDSSAYLEEKTLQRENLLSWIFLLILMGRSMSKVSI